MPGTYPPENINGVCIAGFDAPGARGARPEAVTPRNFYAELQRLGGWRYATFNEHGHSQARLTHAADALVADIAVKERIIFAIHQRGPWDVFCIHLQASDTAAHHLWHTFDPQSPRYIPGHADALPRVYRRLDDLIGRLRDAAPRSTRFLIVSDHGMAGAASTAVYLNRWLAERGLARFAPAQALRKRAGQVIRRVLARLPTGSMGLALRTLPGPWLARLMQTARGATLDFRQCAAFSDELDYAPAIWLNRVGVFKHGVVTDSAAPAILQQLQSDLVNLRHPHTGAALIARTHLRDSLPPGPFALRLPDLLIEPAWPGGYRPSFLSSPGPGAPVRQLLSTEYSAPRGAGMPGVHRRAGIFIACGADLPVQSLPALHIAEAGAGVYRLLNRLPPAQVEAAVPDALAAWLPQVIGAAAAGVADREVDPYTPAEREELMQRLEGLGYM